MLADGFRDGRHELSPLCPGACGARPRLVGDSIRLRRGHLRGHRQKARPARACRFRDGPARDPGKSPRAGCLGHHHQSFKSGHAMSAVHPAPLSSLQGASSWRVWCFLFSKHTRFFPEARSAVRDRLDAAHASRGRVDPGSAACLRRLKPAPAKAGGREK